MQKTYIYMNHPNVVVLQMYLSIIKRALTELGYSNEPEKLSESILYAVQHTPAIAEMKQRCLLKAEEYSEKHVMSRICKEMGICAEGLYE